MTTLEERVENHVKSAKTLERILYEKIEEILEGVCFDGRYNPVVEIRIGKCRCRVCRKGRQNT